MGQTYLCHSYKGTRWKSHKYIQVTSDGRYIYKNTENARLGTNTKTSVKEYSLDGLKTAFDTSEQKKMTDVPKRKGLVAGINRTANAVSKKVSKLTKKKSFAINKWNSPLRNVKKQVIESNMSKVSYILTKVGDKKMTDVPKAVKNKNLIRIQRPRKITKVEKASRIRR